MTPEEHRNLGIEYFNKTWEYIDNSDRSFEEDFEMIHFAHASLLHWKQSGAPMLNIVRGEWQISRVYSILQMGESALKHGSYCLEKTIAHSIGYFDLVFAYEAVARAYCVKGDTNKGKYYYDLALSVIKDVQDDEDKEYCQTELEKIKTTYFL